jgi:hypothetical protein
VDCGLSIDIEMVVRAYRLRVRRIEFPMTEKSRSYGQTHFRFLPMGVILTKYFWHELNGSG